MIQELVLLGLLKEGPKHGYEIRKTIEQVIASGPPREEGGPIQVLADLRRDMYAHACSIANIRASDGRRAEGQSPKEERYCVLSCAWGTAIAPERRQ